MRRFVVFLILLLVAGFNALAQKPFTLPDTILLQEVVSYGELRKYQSGAKIERISADQINLAQEGGLENVLKRFSPIYIKSDAGGLSTIRFRGTSPNHTSINFGGLNVNSLTLGHSNLSNIPSFLFDEISLQYGSSSSVNGSGAIGGALYLGLGNNWTKGLKIIAKSTIGSFGEILGGTKIFLGNGKWEAVTRVYFYQKENDFPFNNLYTGDVENRGSMQDIQKGASLNNKGFLQELNYKFSENELFKSSIWIENSWRQIQPNMQTNYNYSTTQEIENNNIRVWTEYLNNRYKINIKTGLGYVHDFQVFDKIKEQIIQTDRLVSEFQASTNFDRRLGLKAGLKYKFIKPNVHAFADSVVNFEEHFDIFLSTFYKVNRSLKISVNLRKSFVTNFESPFTPSFGAEYVVRTGEQSFLKFTTAVAKSYRVPTFNDRYWGTQGNLDLKPELGNNYELGSKFNFDNGKRITTIGINAFYMNVDNWIEWRNFGIWKAENVLEVVSKGIEFQANTNLHLGKFLADFGFNYTYNPVKAVKTIDETGVLNRQMNYVPKQMGNTFFNLSYKKWRLFTDGQFTGKRFTDDFGRELPTNFIANCGLGYNLVLNQHQFDFTISSLNVLNADYQNERYYAMPGRFFRLSLKYEINNIK